MSIVKNFGAVMKLLPYEDMALGMLRPFVLADIKPELVFAHTPEARMCWHYWRFSLSSSPQTSMFITPGRMSFVFVMDRTSGSLLGIFVVGDPPYMCSQLDKFVGWDIYTGVGASGRPVNLCKWARCNTILYMPRCLPVYDFGQVVGGKLMVLLASCLEVVRMLELRYSYKYALFLVNTLHGKSSQYSRLHDRGLVYGGVSSSGKGMYYQELRKKGVRFLKGEVSSLGKYKGYSLQDQTTYWLARWGVPRAERLGCQKVTFDHDQYRLSRLVLEGDVRPDAKR